MTWCYFFYRVVIQHLYTWLLVIIMWRSLSFYCRMAQMSMLKIKEGLYQCIMHHLMGYVLIEKTEYVFKRGKEVPSPLRKIYYNILHPDFKYFQCFLWINQNMKEIIAFYWFCSMWILLPCWSNITHALTWWISGDSLLFMRLLKREEPSSVLYW